MFYDSCFDGEEYTDDSPCLYDFCKNWVDYATENMLGLTLDECKEALNDLADRKNREFNSYQDRKWFHTTTPKEVLECVLEYIRDCIVRPRNIPRAMDDLDEEDLSIVNRVDERLRELDA